VVVQAPHFDATLAFYRDVEGMPQADAYEAEASARETPWRSLNARLRGPADLQLTLFQELDPV